MFMIPTDNTVLPRPIDFVLVPIRYNGTILPKLKFTKLK